MAELLAFEFVSPERLLMSEEVEQVVVPGTDGDFGVLAGHAPVVSTMRPGAVEIYNGAAEPVRIFVGGGLAQMANNRLTILAEEVIPIADLDRAAIERQIRNAEEDVEDAQTDERRRQAQERLDHLRDILATLNA